ncbi:Spermine/spermidine synthase [Lentzea xinjiangensis]|uniref:Spermine/spermidine synthase n=1 Tax=Lentzea xinjiangensis TaxID=402600 RepID=A0A1H9K764_9PSEU|nr:spermidine synthase [Lentzea xinjiangensis]SEQ95000.1 Spermine/spermidine synthase [Lentzea xinjiangensis]
MSARFQELDWRRTPLGELTLRRRLDPGSGEEIHEIKLNDEFLMSSLFTVAEVELARLALAELPRDDLQVVVGGLGLGYTARTVLEDPRVGALVVVDALGEVIDWHRQGLIPAGKALAGDPRCRLVHGDFFAMLRSGEGFDPAAAGRRFDAIVVDIDHSPRHLLHPGNADFYEPEGLRRLAGLLRPGGVFALWSNEPPEAEFTATLAAIFTGVRAEVVSFRNPLQDRNSTNTVYLAKRADDVRD